MSIWVPKSARTAYRCNICGDEFSEDKRLQWEHHVSRCASRNAAQLHADHPVNRLPGFMRSFDPEFEAYVKRTGNIH